MPENTQIDYRDPEWVAETLGLEKNTVYKYLQDGTLPAVQLGRKWLISERLLSQWLEEETRRQTAERHKSGGGHDRLADRVLRVLGWTSEEGFERFTNRARKVMKSAESEARRLNHEYIGTEHILLGLVKEGSGVGANALKNLEVDLRKVRLGVEKFVKSGPNKVSVAKLPRTPRAKIVIHLAIEEARDLNHNYVGTEHLLLGLLQEPEGVGGRILRECGVTLEAARAEVLKLLAKVEGKPAEGNEMPQGNEPPPAARE